MATKTTYTTIFEGTVRPDTRPPVGDPLGPGRQPGFNPPPDKPRRPRTPRPPHTPGRKRRPFDPSRRWGPPAPSPAPGGVPSVPGVSPGKIPPFVRPIPGFARRIGRLHPWLRAYDYYQFLRESGILGWAGGEPSVVYPLPGTIGSGCGHPPQVFGRANGCYPSPAIYPGAATVPAHNGTSRLWTMWSLVERPSGAKRWYPALGGQYDGPMPMPFKPYVAPGQRAVPVAPDFPPAPTPDIRHQVGLVPRDPRPVVPNPTQTKKTQPDRKVEAPQWITRAAQVAFLGTELADVVDALWDGLSKEQQNAVPKTGVCTKGCLNPGMKYHSIWDKMLAIKKSWPHLTSEQVAEMTGNLVANHFIDAIMGRLAGGADMARIRAGASGWGFVTG